VAVGVFGKQILNIVHCRIDDFLHFSLPLLHDDVRLS